MSGVASGPVLVTGASGQVGSALVNLISHQRPDLRIAAPGRREMDLTDPERIRSCLRDVQPRWIVSSAAYTAVDAAENDRDAAFAINATAPGLLAEQAVAIGATFIHLSTDYVFDGSGMRPWLEDDLTRPLNVYGASKRAGEQAIAAVAARTGLAHIILRTSWVYSPGGKNFVATMLRLLSTRAEPLRVVADQYGAPTSAANLASAILRIIEFAEKSAERRLPASNFGVYHCAGSGETTWYGLASAIREYLRMTSGIEPPAIVPIPAVEYPTPAQRPINSRLNCEKLAHAFGIRLPHWTEAVAQTLHKFAANNAGPRSTKG